MKITILTLFPSFFESPFEESILKRAKKDGLININILNIRDFASDKHRVTDDRPYGGGAGMVLKVEPIYEALRSLGLVNEQGILPFEERPTQSHVLLTSAKGQLFNQQLAENYLKFEELIIICGHYEGVDERVADHLADAEVRIGDYVLTGGEPAAIVLADAVTRLIPGVLGNEASNKDESHGEPGRFTYPQYTRPENFQGWEVPKVLVGGHHAEIETWRESNRQAPNKKSS